jgi:hypothetical protein
MPYASLNLVRERALGISPEGTPDTSRDTELGRFMVKADALIDDRLFIVANRKRRITSLPVLPLEDPPQSLIESASDLAVAYFLVKERQMETAEDFEKHANQAVDAFILRLDIDSEIYGVVLD